MDGQTYRPTDPPPDTGQLRVEFQRIPIAQPGPDGKRQYPGFHEDVITASDQDGEPIAVFAVGVAPANWLYLKDRRTGEMYRLDAADLLRVWLAAVSEFNEPAERTLADQQEAELAVWRGLALHGRSIAKGVIDTQTEALPVLQSADGWDDIDQDAREMLEGYLNYDVQVARSYIRQHDDLIRSREEHAP